MSDLACKARRNIRRDRKVTRELIKSGWTVVRVRECQLRAPARFLNRMKNLLPS